MEALLVLHDAQGTAERRDAALVAALTLAQAWRGQVRGKVELWGEIDPGGALVSGASIDATHALPQADPGARIWLALCLSLAQGHLPLLMRSSYAGMTLAHLRQARALMDGADAAFVTTSDGAYAAAGLRRAVPELFAALPWQAGKVMAATRARAAQRGCRIGEVALEPA